MPPAFDQIVFSGGGTRCFWHGGFLSTIRGPLDLRPDRITGVSGGALSAACFVAERGHKLLAIMGEAFAEIGDNVRWHKIDEAEGITPHQRVYREVVARTLDREAVQAIAEGPAFEVLLAHPPSPRFPRASSLPLMLAYEAELKLRSTPYIEWPERLGARANLVDARAAARMGQIVDLICAAAVIPPVFNVHRWDGVQVIDGGMTCKAPLPTDDRGRTLVLLTRRLRNCPDTPHRLHVMPSRGTPADKMDFTSREKIERTWALGERDGARFLDRYGRDNVQAKQP